VTTEKAGINLSFANNGVAQILFGEHHQNLTLIEERLGLSIHSRGGDLILNGPTPAVSVAEKALSRLYEKIEKGQSIDKGDVEGEIHYLLEEEGVKEMNLPHTLEIQTRRRRITPRSANQALFMQTIQACEMVFGLGPAGTGKTYLAMASAVSMLLSGRVEKIILSRPAVEAGEKLGFLPGDLKEKIDPYLRPLYDALHDMLPADQVVKRLASGEIEIAPLAFMRGRTLENAFIILDEAQNTTRVQMKMFLTRLGSNSRMVITGDMTQVDLPGGVWSGLREAVDVLAGIPDIGFIQFDERDVVRHRLVGKIVQAYNRQKQKTFYDE
jgi:phosphate starvation-inducible PhoH-like protein